MTTNNNTGGRKMPNYVIVAGVIVLGLGLIGRKLYLSAERRRTKEGEAKSGNQQSLSNQSRVKVTPPGQTDKKINKPNDPELRFDELKAVKQHLNELEALKIYADVFEPTARALQILLGVAKFGDSLTPSDLDFYLKDRVVKDIESAYRSKGGSGFSIQPPKPSDDAAKYVEQFRSSTKEEIVNAIVRNNANCETIKIFESYKKILEGLKPQFEKLKNSTNLATAKSIAVNVKNELTVNTIRPFFADDKELSGNTGLIAKFKTVDESELAYPGLFIERDGKLELLGSYNGRRKV
jgi:hypothetical protein